MQLMSGYLQARTVQTEGKNMPAINRCLNATAKGKIYMETGK